MVLIYSVIHISIWIYIVLLICPSLGNKYYYKKWKIIKHVTSY